MSGRLIQGCDGDPGDSGGFGLKAGVESRLPTACLTQWKLHCDAVSFENRNRGGAHTGSECVVDARYEELNGRHRVQPNGWAELAKPSFVG